MGWLGKAVQRRPDDVDILDLLGSVHLDLEDPAAALTCFDRAREIGRKPDQLGSCYAIRRGRIECWASSRRRS